MDRIFDFLRLSHTSLPHVCLLPAFDSSMPPSPHFFPHLYLSLFVIFNASHLSSRCTFSRKFNRFLPKLLSKRGFSNSRVLSLLRNTELFHPRDYSQRKSGGPGFSTRLSRYLQFSNPKKSHHSLNASLHIHSPSFDAMKESMDLTEDEQGQLQAQLVSSPFLPFFLKFYPARSFCFCFDTILDTSQTRIN